MGGQIVSSQALSFCDSSIVFARFGATRLGLMSANVAAPITFAPGQRISYKSVTTGKDFTGYVVDMYVDGGCQLRLDIDGGVKDLDAVDLVRVTPIEGAAPVASPVAYSMLAPTPITYAAEASTLAPGTYQVNGVTYSLPSVIGSSIVDPVPITDTTTTPADAPAVATPVTKKKKKTSKKAKGCC